MGEPEQILDANTRSLGEELAYLFRRASTHAAMADQAADPATQAIHLRLQQLYEERASSIAVVDID